MNLHSRVISASILMLVLASSAYPQSRDILQLQQDMVKLQNQINQLQRSVDEKNSLVVSLVEKMVDQVNVLNAEVQKVNAAVGGIRTDNQGTTGELRTVVRQLNDTVAQLNDGLTAVRTQVNSLSQQLSAISAEGLETPEDILRLAFTDSAAGNFDLAAGAYREFLSKYPNHPRAVEAQLGIADALYDAKRFDQAVLEYDILLQKFADSDKSRTALLKKGLALAETNQRTEAINTLNEVVRKYPRTTEAAQAQAKVTELRSGGR